MYKPGDVVVRRSYGESYKWVVIDVDEYKCLISNREFSNGHDGGDAKYYMTLKKLGMSRHSCWWVYYCEISPTNSNKF